LSYCIYEVDREKRIATLTFNRPEKLNALVPMDDLEEVIDRLYEADRDNDVPGGGNRQAIRGRQG